MKETSPSRLALYNALLVVAVFTVLWGAVGYLFTPLNIVAMLVLDLLLFALIFVSFQYTLQRFIYRKIKLIYKTIYNLKRKKGDKDERRYFYNKTIDSVNQEVQEWGESRKLEIEQLKKNEHYRREFLGNIYHELKTPIFNIQGYVLTLLDGGLDDPAINHDYLLRTSKNINRMIAIVEDLETISNLETSQIALNFSAFDIVELAAEVFDFLEIKARKRKRELVFEKTYDKPIHVYADIKWIRQVLVNLVENTIKYGSGKAGITRVSFFDLDENILIEMTDDGPGIAPEEIPRIFERFYRTQSARLREKSGTGLGLAIVKHIIEAHDQTINVRSRLDVGTTFAFTLKKADKNS
ncbi:MAG: ATP-binding protein [Bacteroidales bacterium]|jgi:two-component system phosphate regulon sensor histidine kinase PhoR|nr:ATP-binding protein [Bacteroidales bacterium]NCU36606.1 sensor histidine kinase [Candidatus Falkowbacteria bacterium]MDD2632736.1 ATP-binding protein [Bacteroidales bacterium]MDD3131337.1 ATP-binding protein [Bacteroidales bacterium]MDD3525519.1 ATP-binding protein [Bacteroidales bacterium]